MIAEAPTAHGRHGRVIWRYFSRVLFSLFLLCLNLTHSVSSADEDATVLDDFTKSGLEDTPIAFATTDFNAHFCDPEHNAFDYLKIVNPPENGMLQLPAPAIVNGTDGLKIFQ